MMGAMSRERFDVCVIGSGAAGGTLASQLVKRGARVALIEAGKYRDPSKLRNHAWPYDQARPPTIPSVTPDPKREPVEYKGDPISVSRGRVVGGRTTHWNAVTLRFSEDDFREWSMNGIEEDWPLTYRELAPYYDQAEELMVVCGTRENLEVVPDGRFIRPLRMRCSENILDRACRRIGMRVIPVRKALATEPGHGRSACHYCGHCMQGCGVSAIFNTAEHLIPQARRTGRLVLRSGWMVRELRTDDEARVRSAAIFERDSGEEDAIKADVFVACCGNIESARLLLNSRSRRFPNGLANSNDVVGRYLHGHITAEVHGYLADLVGQKPTNQDGALDHACIPRAQTPEGSDYAGGFGIQLNVRGYMRPHHARHVPGFGHDFKKRVRDLKPAHTDALAFGKVIGHAENRVSCTRIAAMTTVYRCRRCISAGSLMIGPCIGRCSRHATRSTTRRASPCGCSSRDRGDSPPTRSGACAWVKPPKRPSSIDSIKRTRSKTSSSLMEAASRPSPRRIRPSQLLPWRSVRRRIFSG